MRLLINDQIDLSARRTLIGCRVEEEDFQDLFWAILLAKQEIELSCIWASLSLILTKYKVSKIILPLKNLSGNRGAIRFLTEQVQDCG